MEYTFWASSALQRGFARLCLWHLWHLWSLRCGFHRGRCWRHSRRGFLGCLGSLGVCGVGRFGRLGCVAHRFVDLLLVFVDELQTMRMDRENVGQNNCNELAARNHCKIEELNTGCNCWILRLKVLNLTFFPALGHGIAIHIGALGCAVADLQASCRERRE